MLRARVRRVRLSVEEEAALRWEEPEFLDNVDRFRCSDARCANVLLNYSTATPCKHKFCTSCMRNLGDLHVCLTCYTPILSFDDRQDEDFDMEVGHLRAYCLKRRYGCPEFHQFGYLMAHFESCKINDDNQFSKFLTQLARLEFKEFEEEANVVEESAETEAEKAEVERKSKELEGNVVQEIKHLRIEYHERIRLGESRELVEKELLLPVCCLIDKITIAETPLLQTGHYESQLLKAIASLIRIQLGRIDREIRKQPATLPPIPSEEEYRLSLGNVAFKLPVANSQWTAYNLLQIYDKIQPTYQWTIPDLQSYKSGEEKEVFSEFFQCPGYGLRARIKFEFKDDWNIYPTLRFYEQYNEKEALVVWPKPRVYCYLRDGAKNKFRQMFYPGNSLRNFSEKKAWHKWSFVDGFGSSRKINEATFRIFVEPPSMAEQVESNNGRLNWVIDNFKARVDSEKANEVKYQQSPYFYTSDNGYKVQLRAKLRGEFHKEGKLTVSVCFISRRFQCKPFPPDPFSHVLWLGLVSLTNPASSIVHCVNARLKTKLKRGKWKAYKVDVCEAKDIHKYVEDDCLLFNVKITS